MTLPEEVRCYVLRDSIVVPLIPVDQLPFRLQGVPRQLTPCQMEEAGWRLVGKTQERPSMLAIQAPTALSSKPAPPTKTTYLPPDHNVRKEPLLPAQELQSFRQNSATAAIHREQTNLRPTNTSPLRRPSSEDDVIAPIYPRHVQRPEQLTVIPPRTQLAPRQKEYCDFWMRTGECNYADFTKSREGKGCIYKHEMPSDRNKLRELGFPHGVPKWYKEKTAIAAAGGLNWSRRGMAQDSYDRKLSDEPVASQAFNPSNFIKTRNECGGESTSKPTTLEVKQAPVEVEDLISFEETCTPVATPEPCPQEFASFCSSVTSCDTDVLSFPPSKLLLQTMASTLREEAKQAPDRALEDKGEAQPTNNSSAASENEIQAKPSTHSKRKFRQRKIAERLATPGPQNGLAQSKHAPGSKTKKVDNPCKGGKRRGNGMDPQSEITQHQHAFREKEKLKGHLASSDIQQNISVKVGSV
ncbi:hypothetical protein M3J09_001693 [Ascochyta lentis]